MSFAKKEHFEANGEFLAESKGYKRLTRKEDVKART